MEDKDVSRNADENEDGEKKLQGNVERVTTSDEINNIGGMDHTTLDGVLYLCLPRAFVTTEALAMVRNLRLRDDDVWVVAYPKSGNHWCFEVITMILNQNIQFAKGTFREHITENQGYEMQQRLDAYESPRILGSHLLRVENYPKEIFERKLKIVYLIRNPKDIYVSHYKMWKSMRKESRPLFTLSFAEYFDLEIKGEFIHGDWFQHVLNFEKFMETHSEHPVYVNSYEKMKEDPVSAIKKLCEFLGKPTDLAEDIAKVTEFDNMRNTLNAGKMTEMNKRLFSDPSAGGMFRKGIIGDWSNELTPEQSARIDEIFLEKMSNSQLGALVRDYM